MIFAVFEVSFIVCHCFVHLYTVSKNVPLCDSLYLC